MCYKYAPLVVFLATIGIISGCKYLIHFGIISYDSVVNISFIFSSVFLGLKSVNLLIKMAKKLTYKNKISCSPFLNQCVEIRKCESGHTWDLRLETTTGQNKTPYCKKLLHNFKGTKDITIFSYIFRRVGLYQKPKCWNVKQVIMISSKLLRFPAKILEMDKCEHLWICGFNKCFISVYQWEYNREKAGSVKRDQREHFRFRKSN